MIISLNWLKKFTAIDGTIDELTTLIGARLVEIEKVVSLGEKYKDVIIVKVVTCQPVPDSDHLNVTTIDDGGVWPDVERTQDGLIQVVCGAPNVTAGMLAAWLPPNSMVPDTFSDDDPFVLGSRKLRGYMSNGMLASARELDLFDDHDGIVVIDKDAAPGTPFAEVYELNDYLLTIENKSLTHRPDTFGIIGFAREVAGIQGKAFRTPEWLQQTTVEMDNDGSVQAPTVTIDNHGLSDRFEAVVMANAANNARTPLEIQTYLSRSGVRPINAIVDVTNYMMLLTGQPLHAYDYDKILMIGDGKADIHIRSARNDETLQLLDGKTTTLTEADMVVSASDTAIGLAGAMGGLSTESDSATNRIMIEAATFNLYTLRNMQMRHGVFTEAMTRLTKGLPAQLSAPVLAQATRMIAQLTGATVASPIGQDYPVVFEPIVIMIDEIYVNERLGTQFSAVDIKELLENVEFTVEVVERDISVTVPYWRNDIHIAEDVVEEVGRLSGFDAINPTLPPRDFRAVQANDLFRLQTKIRTILSQAGANEVVTYSFVHGEVMRKAGQNPDTAYRITNSISPDLQYYRQSLTPSLLAQCYQNSKAGYDHFALFELNKFHTKLHPLTDEQVPLELDSVAFTVTRTTASDTSDDGAAFYEAKMYLEFLASELGLTFVYEPLEESSEYPVTQPFEPKRSARVWDAETHQRVGVVGEYKRRVQKNFKVSPQTAGFEISSKTLLQLLPSVANGYFPLSKYPHSERDICFQVPVETMYRTVYETARSALEKTGLLVSLTPLDIYQPRDGQAKNITIRLHVGSYDRTLQAADIQAVIDTVTAAVIEATQGRVI